MLADPASDEGARKFQPNRRAFPSHSCFSSEAALRVCSTILSLIVQQTIVWLLASVCSTSSCVRSFDFVHVVIELDDLERLELESDLVQDAGKSIAGPNEGQELGILIERRFLE